MGGGNNLLFKVVLMMLSLLYACFAQEVIILSDKCIEQNNTLHKASPCHTMDSAFADLQSNTTLQLKPGLHTIRNRSIVLNKTDLAIIGDTENPSSVIIQCDPSHGLVFISVERLSFMGLTIRDCGFQGEDIIEQTFSYLRSFLVIFLDPLADFSAGIFLADITDLTVEDVVIDNNIGLGLFGLNIVGNSRFSRVTFANNHPRMCAIEPDEIGRPAGSGGAMYFQYQDYNDTSLMTFNNSNLLMEDILVESNYNCRVDLLASQHNMLTRSFDTRLVTSDITGSGGITINLAQSSYSVRVNVTESLFRNNSGTFHGSGMELGQYELTSDSHIYVTNTLFIDNGEFFVPNSQFDRAPGGPLIAGFYLPIPEPHYYDEVLSVLIGQAVSTVVVINCTFKSNTARSGAGMYIVSFGPSVTGIQDRMIVRDCLFVNNSANFGSALFVTEISYSAFEPGLRVILDSITTTGNHRVASNEATLFQTDATGVIDINFLNVTLTGSNHFYSNRDTAFSMYAGIITLTGFVNFTDNVGVYGGGLSLDTESYLVLTGESAQILLMRNRALLNGGGIHVNFNTIRANSFDCFLFLDDIDVNCNVHNMCSLPNGRFNISFIDNMATYGSAIYGSSFSSCPWNKEGRGVKYLNINDSIPHTDPQLPIYLEPFTLHDGKTINTDAGSIVADYSTDIEGSPRLSENNTIKVFPGQHFVVPLGALDRLDQPVPVTVFSQLQTEGAAHSLIGGTNRFLLTGGDQNFTNTSFHVNAEENTLYNMTITSNEALVNFVVEVSLSGCPAGFVFDVTEYECLCNVTELTGVSCNENGTLSYPVDTWIGIDDQGRYIEGDCIPDFCVSGLVVLNFSEPDSQCQNNRAGILCGGCAENFSRMIGTSACGQCTHWYLFLIIPFLVLGILLFLVLAVFNVTITDGYINGFIFYANIVTVYLTNYVPVSSAAVYPPQVAIAFLNLNLGIPTCFFNGMTELMLTVLRFLFPAYLMLTLFFVVLCGKCISNEKVSTFFRKIKVTHVFATLILYSYTSIIQTCFDVLAYVSVDGTENPVRWLRDPNVPYDDPWHIVLVVLSLLLLIVFIPFPLLLLFPSLTFRVPFIRNLKPLIDAFIAPFAPGKAYWVSLRLLFRLVFFIISSTVLGPRGLVVLSALLTILTITEARLQPFNSDAKNFVDRTLMTNLTLFSIISIYLHPLSLTDERDMINTLLFQLYLFLVMLSLLFLHYVLIRFSCTRVPYHGVINYITEKVNKLKDKISSSRAEKLSKQNKLTELENEMRNVKTHTSVSLSDSSVSHNGFEDNVFIPYREALLEDNHESNKTASR